MNSHTTSLPLYLVLEPSGRWVSAISCYFFAHTVVDTIVETDLLNSHCFSSEVPNPDSVLILVIILILILMIARFSWPGTGDTDFFPTIL